MSIQQQVISILADTLQLNSNVIFSMNLETAIVGAIPEFDSIAVVSVITALESQYGFAVEDDEITADIFESVGALVGFVKRKLNVYS